MTLPILFVDDDASALAAYQRRLHRQFTIHTALGGEQALALLAEQGPFSVVISDRHMPGMDGITFLSRVRERMPDTVRIMLTGADDQRTAMDAVNEGHIFRFLCKPCPMEVLASAITAAQRQYGLITAEKELLERTLSGSVRMLMEILSASDPALFGQTRALRRMVRSLGKTLLVDDVWALDLAAMLCHVGLVTVPPAVLAKHRTGTPLTNAEADMLAQVPQATCRLLGNIPRLEPVAAIISYLGKRYDGKGLPADDVAGEAIPLPARILVLLRDLVALEAAGSDRTAALAELARRPGWYDPALLDIVSRIFAQRRDPHQIDGIGLPMRSLRPGLVLHASIVARDGAVLVAGGRELTPMLIELLLNYSRISPVAEPIMVVNPAGQDDLDKG